MYQGGTIGLFTGLSLLSVMEIIYWIYRTILAACSTIRFKEKKEEEEELSYITKQNPHLYCFVRK